MTEQENLNANENNEVQAQLSIQRIYTKDISFEAPGTPEVFLGDWNPTNNIELSTGSRELSEGVYEVELAITSEVKTGAENAESKVAFIVEVKQAGIFSIEGFSDEERDHLLNAYCPNLLFPYVREIISDLVTRGSFPQLVLQPINFDALYAQKREEMAAQQTH